MEVKNVKKKQLALLTILLLILAGILIYQNRDFLKPKKDVEKGESVVSKQVEEKYSGEFRYIKTQEGVIIQRYLSEADTVVIPAELEGLPVVGLSSKTFYDNWGEVRNIVLSENIRTIEESTFAVCEGLEKIQVSVENEFFKSIEGVLFDKDQTMLLAYPAKKLDLHYEIPIGIKRIEESTFTECKILETIILPEGLTIIGEYAFNNCSNLKSIILPEGITTLERGTFEGCTNLAEIYLPSTLNHIKEYVFGGCNFIANIEVSEENKIFKSVGGVLFDKEMTTLFKYPTQKNIETYTVPENVKIIKEDAFKNAEYLKEVILPKGLKQINTEAFCWCEKLTVIELPESLIQIGKYAFYNTGLHRIVIPKDVIEIGEGAFNNCENLQGIEVDKGNKYFKSVDEVLFNKVQTMIITYPKRRKQITYEIPNGTIIIGKSAFEGNSELTSIIIPEGVTTLEKTAFYRSKNLVSITIPKSVIKIGDNAFYGCSSLVEITFQGELLEIGHAVFDNRDTLTIYGQDDKLLKAYLAKIETTYKRIDLHN